MTSVHVSGQTMAIGLSYKRKTVDGSTTRTVRVAIPTKRHTTGANGHINAREMNGKTIMSWVCRRLRLAGRCERVFHFAKKGLAPGDSTRLNSIMVVSASVAADEFVP